MEIPLAERKKKAPGPPPGPPPDLSDSEEEYDPAKGKLKKSYGAFLSQNPGLFMYIPCW